MIKDLIKVANRLDSLGLAKEADHLDAIIKKLASEPGLENVNSYLDMENLEDSKDKKDFFLFVAKKIDDADIIAYPEDISFIGPPKFFTREDRIAEYLIMDRDFKRLHDKYGQPVIDAFWRYIDKAADIISRFKDPNPDNEWIAREDLRALNNKITRLRN